MPVAEERSPRTPDRVAMWSALLIAWLGWLFDGMEMGLYSWAMPPALKELLGTSDNSAIGFHLGITVALFLLGMSVGGIVFGRLGDRLGRVKTMIATVAVYATFTGLSGFCRSFEQLAACRFLGAMGLGGEWGLGVALVMETWPNTTRPLLAGLLGAAANVGFLLAAWLTRYFAGHGINWRWALVAGFVPAVLTLAIRLFVKESERWQESQQRGERSSFRELLSPELLPATVMGVLVSAVAVLGMWGVYQAWLQAWVEKLVGGGPELQATRAAARAAVSWYMAVGSIAGSLIGGPLAEYLGRRRSYALFCVGAVAASWMLYLTCDTVGPRLFALAAVGGVFAASFFGWLPLYLPELFPTRVRATGEGLAFNAGRVLSAGGVLVTGALVQMLGGQAHASAIMAFCWVIGLVLIWFAPETKGCDLPD